jgi:hypothetical protein
MKADGWMAGTSGRYLDLLYFVEGPAGHPVTPLALDVRH